MVKLTASVTLTVRAETAAAARNVAWHIVTDVRERDFGDATAHARIESFRLED